MDSSNSIMAMVFLLRLAASMGLIDQVGQVGSTEAYRLTDIVSRLTELSRGLPLA